MDPRLSNVDGKLHVLDLLELYRSQQIQNWRHSVELNTPRSPQVLTVEISCTGAMLPGSLVLDVPGQKRHQVVGGTKAALTLNGLGQADSKEQGWPNTHTQWNKPPYMIILWQNIQIHFTAYRVVCAVCCALPLWKAQQSSGMQSVWYWHVLPASPFVTFWLHWPQTHSWSPQHSSSLVHDWERREHFFQLPNLSVTCHVSKQPDIFLCALVFVKVTKREKNKHKRTDNNASQSLKLKSFQLVPDSTDTTSCSSSMNF